MNQQNEAQVTQTGQAIRLNNTATYALSQIFSSSIGPYGTYKAIITPSQTLTITKDGNVLCRDIQFIHPTTVIVTKAATSLYNTYGDGCSTFMVLCSTLFNKSFEYFVDGISISTITKSLQGTLEGFQKHLATLSMPLDRDNLKKLIYSSLNTKITKQLSDVLTPVILEAVDNVVDNGKKKEGLEHLDSKILKNVVPGKNIDFSMIEVLKMQEGDPSETVFINGLVLDHGNRHYGMPTELEDVLIMITNMSLEYERPEINAQFCYSTVEQREEFYKTEREYVLKRAKDIADFARKLKSEHNKNLLVVSEKGIDPFSLEILAKAGVLALRRSKRRNLERLLHMCGGAIISRSDQLDSRNLGYAQKVYVKNVGEDKFTFVEGTPFKGSCTILVRGNNTNEMDRMVNAIKGTIRSVSLAYNESKCIKGGYDLYKNVIKYFECKISEASEDEIGGFNIIKESCTNMIKVLLRNEGKNVQKELIRIMKHSGESVMDSVVIDNYSVVVGVFTNAILVAINLLMVDEIIKAGKPIQEEKSRN